MVEVSCVKMLDHKRGVPYGRYRIHAEASKVVMEVAYKPGGRSLIGSTGSRHASAP